MVEKSAARSQRKEPLVSRIIGERSCAREVMSDLKVALVSYEFPPYIVGGIVTHCYDLVCSLSGNGSIFDIIAVG
jgi:hypothetical protein